MNLSNSKSLLLVRPNSNRDLVGSQGNFRPPRVRGQSFRTGHNMPFNSTPQFRNLVHHRNIEMKVLGTFHAIFLQLPLVDSMRLEIQFRVCHNLAPQIL